MRGQHGYGDLRRANVPEDQVLEHIVEGPVFPFGHGEAGTKHRQAPMVRFGEQSSMEKTTVQKVEGGGHKGDGSQGKRAGPRGIVACDLVSTFGTGAEERHGSAQALACGAVVGVTGSNSSWESSTPSANRNSGKVAKSRWELSREEPDPIGAKKHHLSFPAMSDETVESMCASSGVDVRDCSSARKRQRLFDILVHEQSERNQRDLPRKGLAGPLGRNCEAASSTFDAGVDGLRGSAQPMAGGAEGCKAGCGSPAVNSNFTEDRHSGKVIKPRWDSMQGEPSTTGTREQKAGFPAKDDDASDTMCATFGHDVRGFGTDGRDGRWQYF